MKQSQCHQHHTTKVCREAERAVETPISRDGMPQQVAIPKPAPIPQGVDVQSTLEQQPIPFEEPVSRVAQEVEQQKMHL